jgi:hypothetical protein
MPTKFKADSAADIFVRLGRQREDALRHHVKS